MAFLHPTSNNTICDCTFMCPSKLLTISSWLWHPRSQVATTLSLLQLQWVYKQANSSQIIQYCLCFCLDNTSSSTSLDLTIARCSWMFHAQMTRACSWVSSRVPAKRPWAAASQIRLPCHQRVYQEIRRLLLHNCALYLSSSQLPLSSATSSHLVVQFLALVTLNCHLVPHFQSGLVALVAWVALYFVAQVPAQLSSLLPPGATLLNKPLYYSLSTC